jgi:hypothetical protein
VRSGALTVGAVRKATGRGVLPVGCFRGRTEEGERTEARRRGVLLKRRRVRQGRGGLSGCAHVKEGVGSGLIALCGGRSGGGGV